MKIVGLVMLLSVLISGCATTVQGDPRRPIYIDAHVVVDINTTQEVRK